MSAVNRSLIRSHIFDDIAEFGLKDYMHYLERQIIAYYLNKHSDSTMEAAKALGIERTTLHMKRKKFGLHEEARRSTA